MPITVGEKGRESACASFIFKGGGKVKERSIQGRRRNLCTLTSFVRLPMPSAASLRVGLKCFVCTSLFDLARFFVFF